MKFSNQLRNSTICGFGALLCAVPLMAASGIACAADEAAPATATTEAAPEPKAAEQETTETAIILRDVNAMRTIEVQSDRQETVQEFFARQKLSLVSRPNQQDGKVWSVSDTIKDVPLNFFASYPLENERSFRPDLFGAYYDLAPTSPTIAALFQNSATPLTWSNTYLIVSGEGDKIETATPIDACVVGRIFVKDENWRPDGGADELKYRGANKDKE